MRASGEPSNVPREAVSASLQSRRDFRGRRGARATPALNAFNCSFETFRCLSRLGTTRRSHEQQRTVGSQNAIDRPNRPLETTERLGFQKTTRIDSPAKGDVCEQPGTRFLHATHTPVPHARTLEKWRRERDADQTHDKRGVSPPQIPRPEEKTLSLSLSRKRALALLTRETDEGGLFSKPPHHGESVSWDTFEGSPRRRGPRAAWPWGWSLSPDRQERFAVRSLLRTTVRFKYLIERTIESSNDSHGFRGFPAKRFRSSSFDARLDQSLKTPNGIANRLLMLDVGLEPVPRREARDARFVLSSHLSRALEFPQSLRLFGNDREFERARARSPP